MAEKISISRSIGPNFLLAGLSLAFTCPAFLVYQIYFWLRYGEWPTFPLAWTFSYLHLPYPTTDWIGVNRLIDYFMDIPTSFAALIVGAMIFSVGMALEAKHS
jgi:hypothetical protein